MHTVIISLRGTLTAWRPSGGQKFGAKLVEKAKHVEMHDVKATKQGLLM
jgi:hypothetical protein